MKREQIKNQKLSQIHRDLKAAHGLANTKAKKGRKSKSDNELPAELASDVDQITRLGKKSAVMLCLWLPDSVFRQQRPVADYKNAAWRYANTYNQQILLIAELYDFVPIKYHSYVLGLPKFGDIVSVFELFKILTLPSRPIFRC